MFSSREKLARAAEHLDALHAETQGWNDDDPFEITRESNADDTEHIWGVHYRTQPDLLRWGILLGDALHNLRGALDHAVYALAVANCGRNPPNDEGKLAFPIVSEAGRWDGSKWRIESLSQPAQTAIERLQPYNRLKPGKWFMPLWWLSRLHDIDKHRLLHVATFQSQPEELVIDAAPGSYVAEWNIGTHVDGPPLLRLTFTTPHPNVYVDLKAVGGVILAIEGEHPVRPFSIYWITKHIQREVEIACRYLAWHLPDPLPVVVGRPALRIEELAPGAEPPAS